jgi:integrase
MTTNRRKKQAGYVYKEAGVWYVRFYDDRIENGVLVRKHVRQRIGTIADFPYKELAREEAQRLLKPINEGVQKPEAVQTLCQFADEQFFPFCEKQVRPSTLSGYKARWRQLQPWCAKLRMRDTATRDIQEILDAIHKKSHLNHDSIRALRSLLKLIFDHAIRVGLLAINPVDKAKVPKANEDEVREDTYAYSLEEVQQMLGVLPEPARTAVATAAFTGVRRGELSGLLWENFDESSIKITQSVWEGHVTRPKTKKSAAPIPVIRPLARMLEVHRARMSNPASGFIFASNRGTAMNMNNLLNREILPALRKAKLAWHGWHGFRRGLATNLKRLGVDLKTIQEILRHAHISVTADIYVKEVSEQAVEAMQRLEQHIEAEAKKAPKPDPETGYYADRRQIQNFAVVQKAN